MQLGHWSRRPSAMRAVDAERTQGSPQKVRKHGAAVSRQWHVSPVFPPFY